MTGHRARRLHVRVDASSEIGSGHFMRCLALAQHWRDLGRPVTFLGSYPVSLLERLGADGIDCVPLDAVHPDPEDLERTLERLPAGALVVLDGYHFDPPYQTALAAAAGCLLVVDDDGRWPAYAGDILLNQNLNAADIVYGPAPAERLLGGCYILLGRGVRSALGGLRPVPVVARRWLVTCGGADPDNVASTVLEVLAGTGRDVEIRVIGGPLNPHRRELAEACQALPEAELIADTTNMVEQLRWAEMAVAAAGTTAWELAALGVPSLLIAIADNQVAVAGMLARAGAARYLGPAARLEPAVLGAAARELAGSQSQREAMSAAGRGLVDGDGVVRVAAALDAAAAVDNRRARGSRIREEVNDRS